MPKPFKKQLIDFFNTLSRLGPDSEDVKNVGAYNALLLTTRELYKQYEKCSKKDRFGEPVMLEEADRATFQKRYEDFMGAANEYYIELNKNPDKNAEFMNVISGTQQAVLNDSRRLENTVSLEGKSIAEIFPRDAVGELREDNNRLAQFDTAMKAVNKGAFIGSPQFDAVMKSFKKVKQLSAAEAQNPGYASEALKEAYKDLQGKLTIYLNKKEDEKKALARKGKQPSTVAKNRTDFAKRLQAFVTDRCNDPELFDELQDTMLRNSPQQKTDKELAYEFMNSVYQPVPKLWGEGIEKKIYSHEGFESIPHLDISGLSVGGKQLSSNEFSALAISTMLMPGFGEQARKDGPGDQDLSPEARARLCSTMYTFDAASFVNGQLHGRDNSFRKEHIIMGIIPARSATQEALQKYQAGDRAPLSNILANGLMNFELFLPHMSTGTTNMYAMNRTFDQLRNVMERDPALKEATFSRYREMAKEAADKLPALNQELENAKKELNGIQKKQSPEFAAAAKHYAKVRADQSLYNGISKKTPEDSLRTLNGYIKAEKVGLRCDKAMLRLREAQRTGHELSLQDKRRCVIDMLQDGALNASTEAHKASEQPQSESILNEPEYASLAMNQESSSLLIPLGNACSHSGSTPTPLVANLNTKTGAQAFDTYFAKYVPEKAVNDLVKTDNKALLEKLHDALNRSTVVTESIKEVTRKANTNNAPTNSRTRQNVKNNDQPSRGSR